MTNRLPRIVLNTIDGGELRLPREDSDKLTLLAFVEPPPGANDDFPFVLDRRGIPTRNDRIRNVMQYALDLSEQAVNKDVEVIAAFLCDDPGRVEALMATNGWACQGAIVPGGLTNPMVRQLGIFSADRIPNVFLLRRDGTVAWRESGLNYQGEFGYPFALLLGMKVHIEVCDVEYGFRALEQGRYEDAVRVFSGPFLPAQPDRFGWRAPRYHGKALAYMGLKEWEPALEAIETAVDAHKMSHYRGRGPKRVEDWRDLASEVIMKEPCEVLALLWSTQADILDALGRKDEAVAVRELAQGPVAPDYPNVYGLFHERLEAWRLSQDKESLP